MRIVVVTPAAPHPFGDTAARWFYVLMNELARAITKSLRLSPPRNQTSVSPKRSNGCESCDGKLTLHCHRLNVDSSRLRRKWQNLMRPCSEMLQDAELTALLQRELGASYDVLHLEQMSTGWLGVDVPQALLNVHFFDAIDWAERDDMGLRDAKR